MTDRYETLVEQSSAPTPDELQPWALRQFLGAYHDASRRARCSRVDFYAGYRAALIDNRVASAFTIKPPEMT